MAKPITGEEQLLVRGKQDQAIEYLKANDIDMWLTFVREGTDPVLTSMITGMEYVVQNAALIFTATGERIALLEPIDVQNGVGTCFDEVITFRNEVAEPLRKLMRRFDPRKVALNYSLYEFCADGLTHGMYLRLMEALGPLGLAQKMVSSEDIIVHIRAVKNQVEIDRLCKAAEIIAAIADDITGQIKAGVTNADLMEYTSSRAAHYGASRADAGIAVNPIGEAFKGIRERPVEPGDLFCSDMGATYKSYCSDIKRCWYVLKPGETDIPAPLRKQWEACWATLELSRKLIVPGAWGYEVHDAAWAEMQRHGFSCDLHSYGHQVGRRAHDAGVWLGERTNKYRPAEARLEKNMVVTLDPTVNRVAVNDPGYFSMGMEEMAIVSEGEGKYLVPPPKEITCVKI
jgi:Xaa-Pro aminopeptidase